MLMKDPELVTNAVRREYDMTKAWLINLRLAVEDNKKKLKEEQDVVESEEIHAKPHSLMLIHQRLLWRTETYTSYLAERLAIVHDRYLKAVAAYEQALEKTLICSTGCSRYRPACGGDRRPHCAESPERWALIDEAYECKFKIEGEYPIDIPEGIPRFTKTCAGPMTDSSGGGIW